MKRSGKVIFVLALSGLLSAGLANAAAAGPLSLYRDADFKSTFVTQWGAGGIRDLTLIGANDVASSYNTDTVMAAAWWKDINYSGSCVNMPAHSGSSWMVPWDNDTMSSYYLGRAC